MTTDLPSAGCASLHPPAGTPISLKRAEMTKELRSARTMLLVVALIMFTMDLLMLYVLQPAATPPEVRPYVLGAAGVIFALFLMLYAFTPSWPRLCLGLGLGLFWTLQIGNAVLEPSSIKNGIILKALFTLALVKGFQSASRANVLRRDLEHVFE